MPLAEAVRRGSGIATMAVGQITEPRQAETILADGQADMVAIGRRLMFDPHWAWKAASELGVFLKYPARYRNANPRIGQAWTFRNRRRSASACSTSCARRSGCRRRHQRLDTEPAASEALALMSREPRQGLDTQPALDAGCCAD